MATTKTLSAAQLLILTDAARRPNRMALPLPADLRARGAARRALLTSLVEAGLLEERSTEDKILSWRQDGQGGYHALRITGAGLAALGSPIGDGRPDCPESVRASDAAKAPAPMLGHAGTPGAKGVTVRAADARADVDARPELADAGLAAAVPPATARPHGKLGRVLDATAAEDGATLAELAALTGWQPHTTRAALTGLRRRGFVLVLGLGKGAGGRKAYRLRPEVRGDPAAHDVDVGIRCERRATRRHAAYSDETSRRFRALPHFVWLVPVGGSRGAHQPSPRTAGRTPSPVTGCGAGA